MERAVLLEEEIKQGEQEREALRIESQRLRDELSDLKVEVEIVQGKLRRHTEEPKKIITDGIRPPSPMSETSTALTTSTSSPTISTPPPAKSETSTLQTSPPSPLPNSDLQPITPKIRSTATPRISSIRPPRHSRGPSLANPVGARLQSSIPSRLSTAPSDRPAPNTSKSLNQIRGLIGRMQTLQDRVHTTRSKLPGPSSTPPRSSPRSLSTHLPTIPSTVTVRSARKRTSASTATSFEPPRSASRLSFGYSANQPPPPTTPSRPSSRTSHSTSHSLFMRPSSRASATGRITPFADVSTASSTNGNAPVTTPHRPRSSISGSFREPIHPKTTPGKSLGHSFSRSVSAAVHPYAGGMNTQQQQYEAPGTPTTARRTTLERNPVGGSSIPTPSGRRTSGGPARRQSGVSEASSDDKPNGDMRPPSTLGRRTTIAERRLSGVGEY
jgi:hypothetical protein